jgi:hypothetical protein
LFQRILRSIFGAVQVRREQGMWNFEFRAVEMAGTSF